MPDKAMFDKFLSHHPNEGFQIILRKNKTGNQHKYYWVICKIIGDELGMSKEEVHDLMKYAHLKEEVVIEATGEILTRIKSTKELSKEEMMEYIDNIIRWCSQNLSLVIPEPGEKLKLDI